MSREQAGRRAGLPACAPAGSQGAFPGMQPCHALWPCCQRAMSPALQPPAWRHGTRGPAAPSRPSGSSRAASLAAAHSSGTGAAVAAAIALRAGSSVKPPACPWAGRAPRPPSLPTPPPAPLRPAGRADTPPSGSRVPLVPWDSAPGGVALALCKPRLPPPAQARETRTLELLHKDLGVLPSF